MTLKPFLTQNGLRVSTDPAGVQINGNTIGALNSVRIQSGDPVWWAATQTSNRLTEGVTPAAVAYAHQGDAFVVHTVSGDDEEGVLDHTTVSRLSQVGALLWQTKMDDLIVRSMAVTESDHVFLCLTLDTDVVFVLLNGETGTITWQTGMSTDWIQSNAVVSVDGEGNLIAACASQAQGQGAYNSLMVVKLNPESGSITWSKVITDLTRDLVVGGVSCVGTHILLSARTDNGFTLDTVVFKLDGDGVIMWQNKILSQQGYDAYAGQITSDVYGNVYVATSYDLFVANAQQVAPSTAAAITKLNSEGVTQWTRRIGPGPCFSVSLSLSVDPAGDVYVAATTLVYGAGTVSDTEGFIAGSNKVVLARYTPQGAVVWQRYLDAPALWENFDQSSNVVSGNLLAVRNGRLLMAGNSSPVEIFDGPREDPTGFVVQLPTSGDTIQIGAYKFHESRVPARFVNWASQASEFVILDQDYLDMIPSISLSSSELAHQVFANAAYQFQFEGDGTFKLPNDGDLQLTQNQTGWISIFGPLRNNNDNIFFRAVTSDADGNMYAVGRDDSSSRALLVKFDAHGRTLYAVRLQHSSNDSSRASSVVYDASSNLLLVVVERTTGDNKSGLLSVDPDTGVVLGGFTLSADDDVIITDAATHNGGLVAAGVKFSEWRYWDVVAQTGSTTSTLRILRSVLEGALPQVNGDWIITGTGIVEYADVTAVERFSGLTQTSIVTPSLGSGATFDVTLTGGEYTVTNISNGGTNYVERRCIRILGSNMEGTTPENDLLLEVLTVNEGVITAVSVKGGTGTDNATYTNVSGTSLTGSGLVLTLEAGNSLSYEDHSDYVITNPGDNYVVGDVITVSGDQLSAATPANDVTATVTAVNLGQIQSFTFSGTHQQTVVKLTIAESVNFGAGGAWQVGESMGEECFLWTDSWVKSFSAEDGTAADRLDSVAVDSEGMIYAAGRGRGGVSGDIENEQLALLTKLNSEGELLWARVLNETDDSCQAKCVVVDDARNLVITSHHSSGPSETVISKFDTLGTLGWQLRTSSDSDSSVALDADGNIYVACEAYYGQEDETAIKVFKLSSSGQILWRRWLGTNNNYTEMSDGRNIVVVGDDIFITGRTGAVADDYDNGFAAKLPTDGGSLGEYDYCFWREAYYSVTVPVDNYVSPVSIQVRNTTVDVDIQSEYSVTWYNQDNNVVPVRDGDGGAIIFGDGTTQISSATDIAQTLAGGGVRQLNMLDRGKHIYVTDSTTIRVPYDYDVKMPIGSTVVIINNSGNSINIQVAGSDTSLIVPGLGNNTNYTLSDEGMATLIKVSTEVWFMSGATIEVFSP